MKMPEKKNFIDVLTRLSVAYFAITFLVPETQLLLWATILLIAFNYALALRDFIRQKTVTLSVIILNIVQLVLFCRLHLFIHDILGAEHYSYALEPSWYDWIELVAVHILRAVDLLDILSAYGIHLQNVTHQSTLAGITLFSMHIMVDIFILGKLFSGTFTRMVGKKVLSFFSLLLTWGSVIPKRVF